MVPPYAGLHSGLRGASTAVDWSWSRQQTVGGTSRGPVGPTPDYLSLSNSVSKLPARVKYVTTKVAQRPITILSALRRRNDSLRCVVENYYALWSTRIRPQWPSIHNIDPSRFVYFEVDTLIQKSFIVNRQLTSPINSSQLRQFYSSLIGARTLSTR